VEGMRTVAGWKGPIFRPAAPPPPVVTPPAQLGDTVALKARVAELETGLAARSAELAMPRRGLPSWRHAPRRSRQN